MCAGALSNHGSSSSCSVEPSCASSVGSSTTSRRWPWLKPALGARRTVETQTRQRLARNRLGLVVPHHAPVPEQLSELHRCIVNRSTALLASPRGGPRSSPHAARAQPRPAGAAAPARAQAAPRHAGGRAPRRPAGAVDAEPVPLALDAARGVRARRADEGAGRAAACQGAAPARHAARRCAANVLGDHDRATQLAASLWPPSYEARLPSARIAELAELAAGGARRERADLQARCARCSSRTRADGVPPTFLWRRVQSHSYVIHVPPSGIWGYGGHGVYTAAAGKVRGEPPAPKDASTELVRTYLAAYGPATKQDIGQWAGVPRMQPITESLERLSLRTFASEDGKVLYDLPRAPLPDPETPAPAAARASVRQPRPLARRPLADPRRRRSLADRHEQRPRPRDDPRRRLRRRHVAAGAAAGSCSSRSGSSMPRRSAR